MEGEKKRKFVHFRTQSCYSMLESTLKPENIVNLALQNDMDAIAVADNCNLFCALELALIARKKKMHVIHSAIFNIAISNKNTEYFTQISLLAKNENGFMNLLKLLSLSFTKDNTHKDCPNITLEELAEYNDGIILLSGYAKGPIGKLLLLNEQDRAAKYAVNLKAIFGDRFYLEIMRHDLNEEKAIESEYLRLSDKHKLPLLATNNVLFDKIENHSVHDVLLCIAQGVTLLDPNRYRASAQAYFKTQEEMIELFHDLPDAIENTVLLVQRCSFICCTAEPSLPKFQDSPESEKDLLYKLSQEGLKNRLEKKFLIEKISQEERVEIEKIYNERLEYELGILCQMNFMGYFLIVSDFIKWSKSQNIAIGPGRGSGAGSVIAWVLDITDLDPIKFGLLFERFLNPERVSMPDFDIDFCQERRHEVISYVRQKYSTDRVGQILTFGKLQAKAVIKDVSKVSGLPYHIADYIAKLVPFSAVNPVSLSQAIEEVAELKQAYEGKGLYNIDSHNELIQEILNTALILEGLPRHSSIHAAGIVIGNKKLFETVPVYRDSKSDIWITQYSMKYCEIAGLVKFDFLGLQTLTQIYKTLDILKAKNINLDLEFIDYSDKKTFNMLSKGISTGVFQFESIGMKNTLKNLQPDNINDIIALGALYRPGPMENIPAYIDCKYGRAEPDYLHPLLEETLKPTYGIIIYQEQVMEIAKKLSGYSLGGADLLRRAMGKKVKAEMDAQQRIFIDGAIKNNVNAKMAENIFAKVAKFAGYGFNKSHATAYGIISYYTAYLKANFPAEFFVASMNLDIGNSDKIAIFIHDIKNFDIELLPPDINLSEEFFISKKIRGDDSIIFALGAIKGVTQKFCHFVKIERQKNGLFKSIVDFVERIDNKLMNKKLLENIIKAGAFDSIHPNRNALIHSASKILAYANSYHTEKNSEQYSLISVADTSTNNLQLANMQDISMQEKSYLEFDAIGLFLRNHPLMHLKELLYSANIYYADHLSTLDEGSHHVKLAGIIVKKDSRTSPRGRFIILMISSPAGVFEANIYDDNLVKEASHLLQVKESVVVSVYINKHNGAERISVTNITSVQNSIENHISHINLYPQNTQKLKELAGIFYNDNNRKKNRNFNEVNPSAANPATDSSLESSSDSPENNSQIYIQKIQPNIFLPVNDNFCVKFFSEENLKISTEDLDLIKKKFTK